MSMVAIEIPEEILRSTAIPEERWETEVKIELALQLYREKLLLFANARRLAGLSRIEFHYLLGEHQIPRQYDIEDYHKDLENLKTWEAQQ